MHISGLLADSWLAEAERQSTDQLIASTTQPAARLCTPPLPFQMATVERMRRLEDGDGLRGGFLATQPGLGKSFVCVALVAAEAAGAGPTLIITPANILHQWSAEFTRHAPALRVARFHGPKRRFDPEAEVIITTIGTLTRSAAKPGLPDILWRRLIIDEVHTASMPHPTPIRSRFVWGLSATPIVCGPTGCRRLVQTLRATFPAETPRLRTRGAPTIVLADGTVLNMRDFFTGCTIRYTVAGVSQQVAIQEATVNVERVDLSADEGAAYQQLQAICKERVRRGTGRAAPLLERECQRMLRAFLSHPPMVSLNQTPEEGPTIHSTDERLPVDAATGNCKACGSKERLVFMAGCGCLACEECMAETCQKCGGANSADQLLRIVPEPLLLDDPAWIALRQRPNGSSKMDTLVALLLRFRAENPEDRCVVLTEFKGTACAIERRLATEDDMQAALFAASSSVDRRGLMIGAFNAGMGPAWIFITTLAASIGTNLVGANHIIFMEPCQNEGVFAQASRRCSRIGQVKPVTIHVLTTDMENDF